MSRLSWGTPFGKSYRGGLDRGVVYPKNGRGVRWNGLISVEEKEITRGARSNYVDGAKVFQSDTLGDFGATLTAYTYPDGMRDHQNWVGLTYRTQVTNEFSENHQIHIFYNVEATLKEITHSSLGDTPEAQNFVWDIMTVPYIVEGSEPGAHLIIDCARTHPWTLKYLEGILYGTEISQPRLPGYEEVISIFQEGSILRVDDHGDGSFSVTGPDEAILNITSNAFTIQWPSVEELSADKYLVYSL